VQAAHGLLFKSLDAVRQQTAKTETVTLKVSERSALRSKTKKKKKKKGKILSDFLLQPSKSPQTHLC
jgi:hypothetical protein